MASHGRKRREQEEGDRSQLRADLGLGGIFKGLGSFIELLGEMAEKGESEVTRTGEARGPGRTRAMYGFTVKIGAGGEPRVERFGNVRETNLGAVVEEVREPMVDVFDEGNEVVVIAEIPGVEENDLQLEVKDDILLLTASHGDRKYSKEVLLPCPVQENTAKSTYRNGVAEIRLIKAPPEVL
jgi:HSP20 family protein